MSSPCPPLMVVISAVRPTDESVWKEFHIGPRIVTVLLRRPPAAQVATRAGGGHGAVANDDLAVDEDVTHADGVLVRVVVGRPVGHGRGIEDGDVGEGAGREP